MPESLAPVWTDPANLASNNLINWEKTPGPEKCFDHQLKSQKTDKTKQNNKTRTTEEDERLTTVETEETYEEQKSARTGQV